MGGQVKVRVEALAVGEEGAVKIMVLRPDEPNGDQRQKYVARAQAQYRLEFGAWTPNPPTVTVERHG